MHRRTRRGTTRMVAALVLALPGLPACYEYVPLTTSTPTIGETVSFEITDRGRVGLSDRFGSGLAEIEGRLVSTQSDEYVVNVYRVSQISGESTLWSGEAVRLQRGFLGAAKGREFSRTRTALVVVTAAAVTGLLIATARLSGVFNGTTEEPTKPQPQSVRIPIGLRP